jgi:hypothetical protein
MAAACCGFNHETQSFSWNKKSSISYFQSMEIDRMTTSLYSLHHEYSAQDRCRISTHRRHQSLLFAQKSGPDPTTRSTAKGKKRQSKKRKAMSTFSTAVCIVPPDDAWDSIQRARHLARDTSFYKVSIAGVMLFL